MSNQEIINPSNGQIQSQYLPTIPSNPTTFFVDDFVSPLVTVSTPAGGAVTPMTAYFNITPGVYQVSFSGNAYSSATTGTVNLGIDVQGLPTYNLYTNKATLQANVIIMSGTAVLNIPAPGTAIRFVVAGQGVGPSDVVTGVLANATIKKIN